MIVKFALEHSPVFEQLDLSFKEGFYVFSGPSGSGKSVLMESLLACFGLREPNALNIETDIRLHKRLVEEFGLEGADVNIKIVKKDKVRYFVNFTPIAKKRLMEVLGEYVKHIHSRGGNELEPLEILRVLDEMIIKKSPTHKENLATMEKDFNEYKTLQRSIDDLLAKENQIEQLKELAAFEVNKIELANPKIGEYERLMNLKKTLSRKEKIQESIQKAKNALESSADILSALSFIDSKKEIIQSLDVALNDARASLEEEAVKLEELEDLNAEEILNRLSLLSDIIHRYGSEENALKRLDEQRIRLKELNDFSNNKDALLANLKELESRIKNDCEVLNMQRKNALKDIEEALKSLCISLKLPPVSISPIEIPLQHIGNMACNISLNNSGLDTLSAGEFNRLRLAMMCIASRLSKKQGVLILDEIDANLSGEESDGVARILNELSKSYQIFAISHQPHIPALATHHFLVSKNGEKSSVKLLNKQERIEEMARMISGANITQEALEFAKKRLSENQIIS